MTFIIMVQNNSGLAVGNLAQDWQGKYTESVLLMLSYSINIRPFQTALEKL